MHVSPISDPDELGKRHCRVGVPESEVNTAGRRRKGEGEVGTFKSIGLPSTERSKTAGEKKDLTWVRKGIRSHGPWRESLLATLHSLRPWSTHPQLLHNPQSSSSAQSTVPSGGTMER